MSNKKPVALFLPNLKGGGAERMIIQLAAALAERGHRVDLVIGRAKGQYFREVSKNVQLVFLETPDKSILKQIPDGVAWKEVSRRKSQFVRPIFTKLEKRLQEFNLLSRSKHRYKLIPLQFSRYGRRILRCIAPLAQYIQTDKPIVLLSALQANIAAVAGNLLSEQPTKLFISERNHLSSAAALQDTLSINRVKLARHFYPFADGWLTVSQGVADDLAKVTDISSDKIVAIRNPVVTDNLLLKAQQPVDHPWLQDTSTPVILAAGRLALQKDYPTMLKAFAIIRKERPVRLLVLGHGGLLSSLSALATDLQISDSIEFHGFVSNPYAFMSRASVFVLSSAYEGSPNVLVEAMACGCPVVSTNCPSGPDEILEGGVYGELVDVGDSEAMARAIIKQLDKPTDALLIQKRAAQYSSKASAEHYAQALGLG